jgi:lipoate-protein ligase A
MRWRLLPSPPLTAADNMALDEALMARARETGEGVLRVYAWATPTLSFGRHQVARGVWDPDRLREAGVAAVRRPTGGRALLHHREVTYSVTMPSPKGAPRDESYARVNRLLLDALRRLGVRASLAGAEVVARPPDEAPCFERPAAGEVVIGERKLVGSAQWREDDALLQHGSILVDDDQPLVRSLAAREVPAAAPAATLRESLGRAPARDEVAGALFEALRELEDPRATPLEDERMLQDAVALARRRYTDDAWTWRR